MRSLQLNSQDQKSLDQLITQGIRIPAQPAVLTELRQTIGGGDYTLTSVARLINKDPGLVATLFKVAQSPVFARGRKFTKLNDVLQVIGIQQTYNLVQSIALANAIGDFGRGALERFWARSGDVAELASLIATDHISVCNVFPDQAYMAGIFLQCGVPVLMMRFPDYCKKLRLADSDSWPDLAEEDACFNVDHCTIGYLVARHWGLPDFVCAAIRYQAERPEEQTGAAASLIAIVQLAAHAYLIDKGQSDPLWPRIGRRVLDELGMSDDELADYFDDLLARFHGTPL